MSKAEPCKKLAIIVAVAKNGIIGRDNTLPWRLQADLQWFKRTTMGQAIVMGRKTYQSIGKALPGRQNIVLSRSSFKADADVQICRSLEQAMELADSEIVFVIGGAQIYRMAMPQVNLLYLTVVKAQVEGDTWFPFVDLEDWKLISTQDHQADENNQYDCEFRCYQRVDGTI